MAKRGLGKGLGGLFESETKTAPPISTEKPAVPQGSITYIRLTAIEPNAKQPRRSFDEEKIAALAESIKENGMIQPIIITETQKGRYKIVAGERRWRAAKKAGLKEIPTLIRKYSDEQIAEVALVENLQREDLNPIEEALGYSLLLEEFGMTQETVSKKVGKSRSAVANSLRLLSLDNDIKNLLITGEISPGHARAILSVGDADLKKAMARRIIDDGLNVRQAEALAKTITKSAAKKTPKKTDDANALAAQDLENTLSSAFGTKVRIKGNAKKGKIEIEYFGNDDLDRILKLFKVNIQ